MGAMGFNVVLQDELGGRVDGIDDPKGLLDKLLPDLGSNEYPFLASIDPYGDTTFNNRQIRHFLNEWVMVSQRARTAEEQALVAYIESLARRCQDEVHVYLKFVGD
jgi:hypothetical protein